MFHPELSGGRMGAAGDPVPYTVAGDNFVTSLLLLALYWHVLPLLSHVSLSSGSTQSFFCTPRFGTTVITETSTELRFQLFLVLQTCLLVAIGYFLYSRASISDTFTIEQYQVISIYAGYVAAYFLFKALLYSIAGWVFFDKKKKRTMDEGLSLLCYRVKEYFCSLLVMLLTYFDFSLQAAVIYTLYSSRNQSKYCHFIRVIIIFFRRNGAFLQIILYFCALEVVPLSALWGGLVLISHYLKINF